MNKFCFGNALFNVCIKFGVTVKPCSSHHVVLDLPGLTQVYHICMGIRATFLFFSMNLDGALTIQ